MSRSKFEIYKDASLSQQLAKQCPEYSMYAGADPRTSLTIARLNVLIAAKILNPKDKGIQLIMDLLNEKRKALFATSDRVNEITKMGLQMPRGRSEVDFADEEE